MEIRKQSLDCNFEQWCILVRDRRWSLRQKHRLLEHFKTPDDIRSAPVQEVLACLKSKPLSRSDQFSNESIKADLSWLDQDEHHLIHIDDVRYPQALKQLPDAPIALFAKGDVSLLNNPQVAIVGSRRPTPVGVKVADEIAGQLAGAGICVTSGMALGIDGIAHVGALNAGGASTAVLGSGLDLVTPIRHQKLFERLSRCGLIISEYPLGYPASRYTFPERNRIVSGLSLGVIIVEAAQRSGTLITARLATEQNRELMVVPGSAMSAQYAGSHALIQQGAALVCNAQDVLHCLADQLGHWCQVAEAQQVATPKESLSHEEQSLLGVIGGESTRVDDIIFASGLTAAKVSSMLITLEVKGVVAACGDGGYINLS